MMMKKRQELFSLVGLVFLVLAIGLVWILPGPSSAVAGPIQLKIAVWEPPKGSQAGPLRAWIKELEEKSKGRVKTTVAWASMGPPPKYYDLALKGIAHITLIAPAYTPGRFPMSEVMQLPFTGEVSSEAYAKSYWELYKMGYFDKEFKNVKVLYLGGGCPYLFQMIKGKDIRKLSDVKGKKMRASGALHTRIIKALGGNPVGMSAPEIPIAMQKGVIDGQLGMLSFITAFRSDQITKSVTRAGVSGLMFAVVMNKKAYEKLPGDIKAIMDELGPKYSALDGAAFDKDNHKGIEMMKAAGGVVHELPPADMEAFGKIMAPIWKEWIAEKEAKGLPGKKIVTDFYNILKGMGVKKPFHGYTP